MPQSGMQALLLAGGRGNRLDELTIERNKCMIQLAGKPLIWYNLKHLANAGIKETVIVVGYKAETIINTFGTNFDGMSIRYVLQKEQRGIINAVECASHEIKEDFLLALADEVHINPRLNEMIEAFKSRNVFGICGVVVEESQDRIKHTYAIIPIEKRIVRLIEKPSHPLNNFMGTGYCIFKHEILTVLERTPVNQSRGEKELPDWIQCAIDVGHIIELMVVSEHYININYKEDVDRAKQLISKQKPL